MLRGSMLLGLCILGLALLVGTSASQEKKGKIKGQLPSGWKALNLSEAQKEKVYEINVQYKAKIDELNKKIDDLEAERHRTRVAVLTAEQKELLAKLVLGEAKKKEEKKKTDKKPADK
ncbi:MAG: hypothetical protein L0Y71_02045 [Gemmataceae bacterium]|nr:hypothetical protein [Gemmataceae bacterium]